MHCFDENEWHANLRVKSVNLPDISYCTFLHATLLQMEFFFRKHEKYAIFYFSFIPSLTRLLSVPTNGFCLVKKYNLNECCMYHVYSSNLSKVFSLNIRWTFIMIYIRSGPKDSPDLLSSCESVWCLTCPYLDVAIILKSVKIWLQNIIYRDSCVKKI